MTRTPVSTKNQATLNDGPTIRKTLGMWYRTHQRPLPWRKTDDPYKIWLSEVMLQQTQVKTVIPYYHRFLAAFPDVVSLADAAPQKVLKLWEGLGYYRRAHHLMAAAREIVRDWEGRLPDRREAFRRLPGVGDYIANAVMSIAFHQPWAVVDGNVKRVLSRLFRLEDPVNSPASHRRYQAIADGLLDPADPSAHNQALMELGALVCTPRQPACTICPLAKYCQARIDLVVDRYPVRQERAAIPQHAMVAGIIKKKGKILLVQRPDEGFLAGLWEFPGGRRQAGESEQQACLREILKQTGLTVSAGEPVARVRHAYTHFKITLVALAHRWKSGRVQLNGPSAFRWVRQEDLQTYPLPGAVKKVLAQLHQRT